MRKHGFHIFSRRRRHRAQEQRNFVTGEATARPEMEFCTFYFPVVREEVEDDQDDCSAVTGDDDGEKGKIVVAMRLAEGK